MSQLSPETINRIEAEAKAFDLNNNHVMDDDELSYIAGATSEALRYKACVDALKSLNASIEWAKEDNGEYIIGEEDVQMIRAALNKLI
jgi:hypothetical protein